MLNVLPLAFSSDAAILQTWKKRSYTPVVGQLLSLPPHLRLTFHGIYMSYIALIYAYIQYIMLYVHVYCMKCGTLLTKVFCTYVQQIDRTYTYRVPAVGCATAKDSKLQHYVRCYLQTLAEAEFVFWNYGGRCCWGKSRREDRQSLPEQPNRRCRWHPSSIVLQEKWFWEWFVSLLQNLMQKS